MAPCKHIDNSSIIIDECMTLRDDILAVKNKSFLDLEIEGDSNRVINCYNKKININSSILLLMDIYICQHIYREANITIDCLAKKEF